MSRRKRRFSYEERYAIWRCHEKRCWQCKEPLRLHEVTVDHVLPEVLLDDDDKRQKLLADYGLPMNFNINGYENWLPCHNHCNQKKGNRIPEFIPGHKVILDRLGQQAREVERAALSVASNAAKDEVFRSIFAGLERQAVSMSDVYELLQAFIEDPAGAGVPDDVMIFDTGYWIRKDQIISQELCRCNRDACVGENKKILCYFQSSLSPWVIKAGLYWRCYDETIECPRCSRMHKRGHIGRQSYCDRPFQDQAMQCD